ncbi:MAG TPA: SDR family oxidoreductase [Acidimicrobiales bacterium]|nr:SDR family oxidoreductase [Acidimicrobiales bacterium]
MDKTDMTGKTVVITGANSGIGRQTALALARTGARVVITARDQAKGMEALSSLRDGAASDRVDLAVFDLGDLASVRSGAEQLLGMTDQIDVLVNNAGVVLSQRRVTPDGYEATFAINHLGPFLLTALLLDRIKASAPARIVNVASTAHTGARHGLDFDDLQSTRRYRGMQAYARSKLANIYFTTELARRLSGTGVTANCLHPGTVATGYGHDGDATGALALGLKIGSPFFITPEKGARTSVYLASAEDVRVVTGKYFVKCKPRQPSKAARDDAAARRLWQVSEELVGQT